MQNFTVKGMMHDNDLKTLLPFNDKNYRKYYYELNDKVDFTFFFGEGVSIKHGRKVQSLIINIDNVTKEEFDVLCEVLKVE